MKHTPKVIVIVIQKVGFLIRTTVFDDNFDVCRSPLTLKMFVEKSQKSE